MTPRHWFRGVAATAAAVVFAVAGGSAALADQLFDNVSASALFSRARSENGSPRRRRAKACCTDVNSRRATSSASAAKTLTPSITYGRSSWSEGWKRSR